jgi:hypothetical protein
MVGEKAIKQAVCGNVYIYPSLIGSNYPIKNFPNQQSGGKRPLTRTRPDLINPADIALLSLYAPKYARNARAERVHTRIGTFSFRNEIECNASFTTFMSYSFISKVKIYIGLFILQLYINTHKSFDMVEAKV